MFSEDQTFIVYNRTSISYSVDSKDNGPYAFSWILGVDDVTLGTRVQHHLAPGVVGAIVGAADGAVHVPGAAGGAAAHAARHPR